MDAASINPRPLTDKQRVILAMVARYYRENGEPMTVRLLARRLKCHPATAHEHLRALHRKGWIQSPAFPKPKTAKL